jgi:hypothetical protein
MASDVMTRPPDALDDVDAVVRSVTRSW